MANIDQVRDTIAPLLSDLDAALYDLEFTGGLLKVTLDRNGGVDLETLAEANRRISRALDLEDPIPGRYTLEVSSPGLERVLRTTEHFARAMGERIRVKSTSGADGIRRFEGMLSQTDDDQITVVTDAGPEVIVYGDIDRARTVFVWGPAAKPGGPKPGGPKPGGPKPGGPKSSGPKPATKKSSPTSEVS